MKASADFTGATHSRRNQYSAPQAPMSEQVRQPPDQLREVFIGRQPILDRDQGLAGYELLFRATTENSAHLDGPRAAAMALSLIHI